MELPFCGPRISAHALSLDYELTFYLKKIYFLENDLKSPLIRKKTLSVTLYLENTICGKLELGLGVRLPIGKVQW